jgi:enamine deaminase RidA (YjgF/YER057c/UK114 family)
VKSTLCNSYSPESSSPEAFSWLPLHSSHGKAKGTRIHKAALCLFPLLLCLILLTTAAGAQSAFQIITPAGYKAAAATPPPAILANNTLYLSAQSGITADGTMPKDFSAEVTQSLQNIHNILQAASMDYKDLATLTIYLKDTSNIAAMNQAYWATIGDTPPARTVLVVGDLPNNENIAITAIAVKTTHREVIHPAGWPSGAHLDPAAIQTDDVLYLSAQTGDDPITGTMPADFATEAKQAMENMAAVLKAANMTMANVIWVNPYLSSTGSQERTMNKTYAGYFEMGNTPARGTFTVIALPGKAHVAFTAIAGADLTKRRAVRPKNEKPSATASPGMLYGDTLYLSAKDAYVPVIGIISPNLDIQTKLSMRNLLDGLQEADMDFTNVVSSAIYLRETKDEDAFGPIYRKFFKGAPPTQTILQQNLDTKDIDTEQISFIAVRAPAH